MKVYSIILSISIIFLIQHHVSAQDIIIENESSINTEDLEFAPSFYKDGIVFVSSRKTKGIKSLKDSEIGNINTFSIFKSTRNDDGNLGVPELFSLNINTPIHEGPITFSSTGEEVYFTRNNTNNGKEVLGTDNVVKMQLLSAKKNGNEWSDIKKLPFNNDNYNIIHASISVDNDRLILASDMPGGYGGYDLYVSEKVGESWTFPQNLGPEVNSDGNESFPFLHADGILYFSSNRPGGNGGLDIYYTLKLNGNEWVAPVNMEAAINSSSDDFSLIVDRDKKNGYFASNREGGKGGDDIYSLFAPNTIHSGNTELTSSSLITVIDKESGLPIAGTTLELFTLDDLSLNTDTPAKENRKCVTDKNGSCRFSLPTNSYYTTISADGYSPTFEEFEVSSSNAAEFIFALDKEQDCVPLKGVIFNKENQYELSNVIIRIEESDVAEGEVIEVSSDNQGLFKNCLECNKLYAVRAVMNGQIIAEKTVSTKNVDCESLKKSNLQNADGSPSNSNIDGSNGLSNNNDQSGGIDISLEAENVVPPVQQGDIITLSNIYYNFDDDRIRPDARVDLDKLIEFMNRYPSIEVELSSHTDSRGSNGYNYTLSQRRADNAVNYLTNRGISRSRISPKGYGETQILNECVNGVFCDEQGHQYNRRTEVRISKINIPNVTIKYYDNLGQVISTTYSEYLLRQR